MNAGGGSGTFRPITDFITAVTWSDGSVSAQLVSDAAPTPGTSPSVSLLASSFSIPGGTKIVGINSGTAAWSKVIVAVAGASGYFELDGVPTSTFGTILLTVAQDAPVRFAVQIAVAPTPADPIGPYKLLTVNLTSVGTGDVQVSLAWDTASDVDLHVVEPTGEEIYYGHKNSASGGTLDLDSNAGCNIDGKDNENVTWAGGTPPRGEYIVRVDNWDSCSQSPIHYVVTVNVKGQTPLTFVGTFSDAGDSGGAGSGVEITRFTY